MKIQSFLFVAGLAVATLCFNRLAGATSIPVNDPSFEFGYGSDPTTGWVNALGGSWGIFNPGGSGLLTPPATDGTDVAYGNGGTAYQILALQVAVGIYTIQVDVGHRKDGLYSIFVLSVLSTNLSRSTAVDFGDFSLPFDPPLGGWTNLTATIVITNGSPAIGGNLQLNLNSPGIQVVIDNLRVEFVPFAAVLTNALLINGADFQFTIHGSGSQVVLGNTNLVNPNGWIPLYTNTAPLRFHRHQRIESPSGILLSGVGSIALVSVKISAFFDHPYDSRKYEWRSLVGRA
ncbi:MAG: hypothetical protein WCS42_12075 [Verrucomicrobiota bacterium]